MGCRLTPEEPTGDRDDKTLTMLGHTASNVASTVRDHIVYREISNSRTIANANANANDPTLLEPIA